MTKISTLAGFLILLLFGMNVQAQASDTSAGRATNENKYEYEGLFYRILSEDEKTVALTKGDHPYWGYNDIPSSVTLDGVSYTVTEIDDEVFMDLEYLSAKLPNTISKIGDRTFAVKKGLDIYSKILHPLDVTMGEDVFGTAELDYMYFTVPIESEDDYLMSEEWNNRGIMRFYTPLNGFYYILNEEEGHKIADLNSYLSDVPYDEEELVVPPFITYGGDQYDVDGVNLDSRNCSPKVKKVTITTKYLGITDLPNLEEVNFDGSIIYAGFYSCPNLNDITFLHPIDGFRSGIRSFECPSPSLVFKGRLHNIISSGFSVSDAYPFFGCTDAADVYFYDAIPPVVREDITLNSNLTVHVPQGAKDVFEATEWNACTIVEDLPAQNPKLEYGYNGNDLFGNNLGFTAWTSGSDIEHAMRLPSEAMRKYQGAKITEISFYTVPLFSNDMKQENVEYVFVAERGREGYLAKVPVECVRGVRMTIPLPTPVTIGDKDLFVGVGRKDILTTWDVNNVSVENGLWYRILGGNAPAGYSEWENSGSPARPITCTIEGEGLPRDIVTLFVEKREDSGSARINAPAKTDSSRSYGLVRSVMNDNGTFSIAANDYDMISEAPVHRAESRSNGDNNVRLTLQNRTPEKIKNFKISATDNGQKALDVTMDQPLMPNQATVVELAVPFADSNTRTHQLNIGVTEIDGKPDEIPENSVSEVTLYEEIESTKSYARKVVVEEGTGTWCGWCPRGIVGMEKMAEKYPDSFIGIAVHSGDRMSDAVNYEPIFEKFTSFPISITNRKQKYLKDPDTATLDGIVSAEIATGAIASVNAEAVMNDDGKHIKVTTVTRFGYESRKNNVRIAYVITEDGLGPYMQNNAYSGSGAELEGWSDAGPEVSTIYNEVARGIYDYNGVEGSTPASVTVDEPYSYEYTIEIPSKVKNVENINIIAMLIDGDTGEILNADKVKIGEGSSSINGITIDGDCDEIEAIYNLQGIKVAQPVEGQVNIVVFKNGQRKLIRY